MRNQRHPQFATLIGASLLPFVLVLFGCQRANFEDEITDLDTNIGLQGNPNPAVPNAVNAALRNSALSQSEQKALQQVIISANNQAPASEATLGADIIAEAKRLKQAEEEGANTALARIALIKAVIDSCEAQVEQLTSKPGYDMRGTWLGTACTGAKGAPGAQVRISISGDGTTGPYTAGISTKGQVGFKTNGTGIMNGDPWGGDFFYAQGSNGSPVQASTVHNRKFSPAGKSGAFNTCAMGMVLEKSTNDAPERTIEMTRVLYACFSKALWVISPLSSFIFQKFPAAIADVFLRQMLGLRSGAI